MLRFSSAMLPWVSGTFVAVPLFPVNSAPVAPHPVGE